MPNAPVPATATGLPARRILEVHDHRPGVGGTLRLTTEVLDDLGAAELAWLRQETREGRRRGTPLFRCGSCRMPVHVRVLGVEQSGVTGGARASFAHDPKKGLPCPYRTCAEGSPEEIEARRFRGKQEGKRHRRLKATLLEALRRDPACEEAVAEEIVRHEGDWRKPDVQASLGGQRVGFDIQLVPPLLHSILGRQHFYAGAGMAHLWVVDAADLSRLQLQGFQDVVWPQGAEVLGWDERTAEASAAAGELVMMRLQIAEDADRRRIEVTEALVSRDAILAMARRRVPIAQDPAARALWEALRVYDETRGEDAFAALAAEVGVPGWEAVRRDALIGALTTLAALVTGHRHDASRRGSVAEVLDHFLAPDAIVRRPNDLRRAWAPVLARAAWSHPPVRRWIERGGEKTRARLETALAECAAAPRRSQALVLRWGPLLDRLFPGLRLGAIGPGRIDPLEVGIALP